MDFHVSKYEEEVGPWYIQTQNYSRISGQSTTDVLSFVGYSISQSSDIYHQHGPYSVVDDDTRSCTWTKRGVGEYWKIQFNQSVTVAGVSLRLNGGSYTIQVQKNSSKYSSQHVCSDGQLPNQFTLYSRTITCNQLLYGDVIIVNKTSYGFLKLCDFKLKVCEVNTLGIPCTKCTPESTCRSCDGSHYGVWCEQQCSHGCVLGSCDELDGTCSRCQAGYSGSKCQLTGDCSFVCKNCSASCSECDVLHRNCTVCRESRFGEMCQLDCPQHCEKCDINTGACLQGLSYDTTAGTPTGTPTSYVIVTCVLLLVILLLIGINVCIYFKKHSRTGKMSIIIRAKEPEEVLAEWRERRDTMLRLNTETSV